MKKKSVLLLLLVLTILIPCFSVQAEEKAGSSSSFSISPLNPDTNEPQSDYFNLLVTPKEEKNLQVRVYNSSNEDLKVQIAANNGTTNNNGITSYQGEEKRDSSLDVSFSDIATIKESVVTVPKNGFLDVPVHVVIPEKAFDGVILGGIRVTLEHEKNQQKPSEAAVTNNIAYTVGVVLRENDKKIDPMMAMNEVTTEQRNYRNYISANLQNKAPTIIKALTAKAEVFKKGESTVLYMASNQAMRMAPHSNFNFGISLEDQPFVAGDYTIKVSGTADEIPYQFEKDFTIDKETIKDLNKNAVFVEKTPPTSIWWYVVCGVVLLVVLGCVFYVSTQKGKKRSKKNKDRKEVKG